MAAIDRTAATLRISGDSLDPAAISRMLGHEPTSSQVKGQEIVGSKTGQARIAKTGLWRLEAKDQMPADLDAQIDELLSGLSSDLRVWGEISSQYNMDLFCGLLMLHGKEGLSISAESLFALGSRGIELGLDINGERKDS